jgi:hypothetical protein
MAHTKNQVVIMRLYLNTIFFFVSVCFAANCLAGDRITQNISRAFKDGSAELAFRPRYENSKQQGLLDAKATTLRTTVGYETAELYQSTFKVELVDVANFFGLHYNPGVSDLSLPQYTLIADPSGAGITEAKIAFNGLERSVITVGRQYIQLNNERFIGKNDFRQYPQSFDAISLDSTYFPDFEFYYAYVFYVNTNNANGRAIDGRHRLSTNLINIDWTAYKFGTLGGYIYFNDDHTVNTDSNVTLGIRLASSSNLEETDNYSYYFEVARQQARFNNPNNYIDYYVHCILSKTISIFTGTLGYENLGGKSSGTNRAFITPLGSVDNFNGMAEAFTTTPSRGLQDAYATISGTNSDITIGATYHFFRLDKGPGPKNAGQEVDVFADFILTTQLDFYVGYAKYNAKNNVEPSTRRFWIMLVANLL